MTAQELIEILQGFDPETEVFVKHTASDYWRTKLASEVIDAEIGQIRYSDYHRQNKVDDDEDYEDDGNGVILLQISQSY